jgi:hypothetical protein
VHQATGQHKLAFYAAFAVSIGAMMRGCPSRPETGLKDRVAAMIGRLALVLREEADAAVSQRLASACHPGLTHRGSNADWSFELPRDFGVKNAG